MKNVKTNIGIFIFFLMLPVTTFFAQDVIELADDKSENSYIYTSLNYIRDAVFMGKKDSVASPYLYPTLTYHHKSGLYIKGALSYLTKSDKNSIDLFLTTVGVDFEINKFSADLSATKYFFNEESNNVISQVEVDVSANIRCDFTLFNLSLTASNYFSNNTNSDFFLSTEISHDFITNNEKFQFSPAIGLNFGSQNFYEQYYINTKINNGGLGTGTGNGTGSGNGNTSGTSAKTAIDNSETTDQITTITELVIDESEKFKLMAIEFSLPIWYVKNSFAIYFSPVLAIPQSESTLIENGILTKEKLNETFYWMVGIGYKFN